MPSRQDFDYVSPLHRSSRKPVRNAWEILARWVIAALVVFAVSAVADAREVHTLEGRVVGVTDGDTVTLLSDAFTQHQIRLSGIEAPEKNQAFGSRAKQTLSALVFGRRVTVTYEKLDRYQRWVGRVFAGEVDVNRALLAQGMAWHYTAYEREQPAAEREADRDTEDMARRERRGLWADGDPTPPWEFRKARRER